MRARSAARVTLALVNGWVPVKTEPTSDCRGQGASADLVSAEWNLKTNRLTTRASWLFI